MPTYLKTMSGLGNMHGCLQLIWLWFVIYT